MNVYLVIWNEPANGEHPYLSEVLRVFTKRDSAKEWMELNPIQYGIYTVLEIGMDLPIDEKPFKTIMVNKRHTS